MRANGLYCRVCQSPQDGYSVYEGLCRDCAKVVIEFAQRLAIGSHLDIDDTTKRVQRLIDEVQGEVKP